MFDRFRTDGRRVNHGALWCSWIDDAEAVPPRVAYALGRTVGGAVVRNRLRRRLRAVVAAEVGARGMPAGWYLVGASAAATGLDAAALRTGVASLFARIRAEGAR